MTYQVNLARRARRMALASTAILALVAAGSRPASAQWAVFDPWNYSQNILTAARELQQVNNDLLSLQNEAQMLINQGRELTSLPYSSLQQITSTIQRTQDLLRNAQGIAYDAAEIQRQFDRAYPHGYSTSTSSARLVTDARSRWSNALDGFQDALKTQATVVANLDATRTQVSALVGVSQAATGSLQASQAGNQLLALQSQQLTDVTALLAAQGRAQSLQGAQAASSQDQSREQLRRFLMPGTGYQPTAITMFHN